MRAQVSYRIKLDGVVEIRLRNSHASETCGFPDNFHLSLRRSRVVQKVRAYTTAYSSVIGKDLAQR